MPVMLIDGNSVGHANNAATRLTIGDYEVQAIFGTLNSVRELKLKHPDHTPIVLWDGRAQWRYDLYPDYKAKRNLDPNKKPKPYEIQAQKMREAYHKQRPDIVRGLKLLGVRQIIPTEDEADDLAGYLSRKFDKVLLISRDHDWLQLVNNQVSWFNPVEQELVTGRTFEEYTGYKYPLQFVQEKALVGDSSDNITGVAGIGEKAAPLILGHYGTVENLLVGSKFDDKGKWVSPMPELNRYRKKIGEFVGLGKKTEGWEVFYRNMALMGLLNVATPNPATLTVMKDPIDVEGFLEFCRELSFYSILRKHDEWLRPFVKSIKSVEAA